VTDNLNNKLMKRSLLLVNFLVPLKKTLQNCLWTST